MAANFPNSPATGDSYSLSGVTYVYDGSAWKASTFAGGLALKVTVYTSGTAQTFTPQSNSVYFKVIATGGGGGGGGSDSDATGAGAGGGGEAGGTCIKWYNTTEMGASATYTVGAGGTGGLADGGTNGADGTDTTFDPAGTGATLTAAGGDGGNGSGTKTTDAGRNDGGGWGTSEGTATNGDINITGGNGGFGWSGPADGVSNPPQAISGHGGSSYWGGGAGSVVLETTGNLAGGEGEAYGSGGSGAVTVDSATGQAGGDGQDGIIVIEEYMTGSAVPGLTTVDNTIPRFNGTAGLLQTSNVSISDTDQLICGTAAAGATLQTISSVVPNLQVTAASAGTCSSIVEFANSGFGPILGLCHSRGATVNTHTIIANSDRIGAVYAYGSNGTSFVRGGGIEFYVDGTPGSGGDTTDIPTRIVFATCQDGGGETLEEKLRIGSAGGLTFPATQLPNSDANTLDDYEEGTWTPAYSTTGTGFTSITYDGNTWGIYTKVGNTVRIQLRIATDSVTVGSASGNLRLGTLPFTSQDIAGFTNGYQSLSVAHRNNWAATPVHRALVIEGSTLCEMYHESSATAASATVAYTAIGTGADANLLYAGGTYMV